MEAFMNMMSIMAALPNLTEDIADILPVEISQMIFRYLDGRSLLNAASVSRKWQDICRGDPQLRQTAYSHFREERRLKNKLRRAKRPYETVEVAEKYKKTSTSRVAMAPPTTFEITFSGDTSGLTASPQNERNFEPRKILVPKRSMNRLK
ncbi:hypothetical protein PV327_008159 [Microctonus hyperodae]|uniref:F-box domain-containing protein n=1 Tax=Microctonus hyperodae TaxID=165561 RepID=A0AA39KGV0_MICHY|nr:hypothetical protein PV327_008159 [Microctonus hyperodae]